MHFAHFEQPHSASDATEFADYVKRAKQGDRHAEVALRLTVYVAMAGTEPVPRYIRDYVAHEYSTPKPRAARSKSCELDRQCALRAGCSAKRPERGGMGQDPARDANQSDDQCGHLPRSCFEIRRQRQAVQVHLRGCEQAPDGRNASLKSTPVFGSAVASSIRGACKPARSPRNQDGRTHC